MRTLTASPGLLSGKAYGSPRGGPGGLAMNTMPMTVGSIRGLEPLAGRKDHATNFPCWDSSGLIDNLCNHHGAMSGKTYGRHPTSTMKQPESASTGFAARLPDIPPGRTSGLNYGHPVAAPKISQRSASAD